MGGRRRRPGRHRVADRRRRASRHQLRVPRVGDVHDRVHEGRLRRPVRRVPRGPGGQPRDDPARRPRRPEHRGDRVHRRGGLGTCRGRRDGDRSGRLPRRLRRAPHPSRGEGRAGGGAADGPGRGGDVLHRRGPHQRRDRPACRVRGGARRVPRHGGPAHRHHPGRAGGRRRDARGRGSRPPSGAGGGAPPCSSGTSRGPARATTRRRCAARGADRGRTRRGRRALPGLRAGHRRRPGSPCARCTPPSATARSTTVSR